MKERSAEYHHVTDLVAEQRAFWPQKIAIGIGLGLFHNSLRKLVSVKHGAGVGVYFFLENAVLWLGLFRDRVRFRFRIRVRVRVRVSVNPNPNPKTAFFKKR